MNYIHRIYRALPFLFWVAIIFGFNAPWVGFLTLIAAGIHEGGHIGALLILRKRYDAPFGKINGLRIKTGLLSYKEEIIVYSSGPLANIICSAVCFLAFRSGGDYISTLGILNMMTGLSNLMIIKGYDGYGIVSSLLNICVSAEKMNRILRFFSMTSLGISVVFALYLCYCWGEGFWIYCIFICALFRELEEVRVEFFKNS